ncbi:MAG: hypothetical protein DIU83_07570 [Bacillota bacterium]|nr:MAG: hypothetical protein DIU83_07570 [Bacillota bacterium]
MRGPGFVRAGPGAGPVGPGPGPAVSRGRRIAPAGPGQIRGRKPGRRVEVCVSSPKIIQSCQNAAP